MTKRKALGSGLEALLSSKLDKKSEKEVDNLANQIEQQISVTELRTLIANGGFTKPQ